MHKINIIFTALVILSAVNTFSQSPAKPAVKANFTGMAFLGYDGSACYFNFGGPGLRMNYKHWMVSANMLPSLRFIEDKPRPFVTPSLGAGLMIGYKRFIVGIPVYYVASKLKWHIAPGIGVRIGK